MFQSIMGIIMVMFSLYTLDSWELLPDDKVITQQQQQVKSNQVLTNNKLSFTERIAAKQHKVEPKVEVTNSKNQQNIVKLIKTL